MNDSFQVKKTINYKAILIVLGVLAALAVGVHFLHAIQVKRNAADLLQEAKLMQDEGKLNEARDYLKQYVGMVPDDVEARVQYGMVLEKFAKKINKRGAWGAPFDVYAQVIIREPDRQDILRRQAKIALKLGRFPTAKDHLTTLLKAHPEDPELNQLMARALWVADQNFAAAGELYSKALNRTSEPDLFLEYAQMLYEKGKSVTQVDEQKLIQQAAYDQVEEMVRLNKNSLAALTKAADFYMAKLQWEAARKHLDYAVDVLKARDVEVFILADQAARGQRKFDDALAYVRKGLAVLPGNPFLMGNEAVLLTFAGKKDEAQARVDKIFGKDVQKPGAVDPKVAANPPMNPPANPPVNPAANPPANPPSPAPLENQPYVGNLIDLEIELNQTDKAREMIKKYREKGSRGAVAYLEARLAMKERAWATGRRHLEELLSWRETPTALAVRANLLLAECYDKLGNRDKQLQACMNARQKAGPKYVPARKAYAACLASMGKYDEAIKEYLDLAGEPLPLPGVRLELARILLINNLQKPADQQDWPEVEQALDKVPAKEPGEVAVKLLRAEVLLAQRKYDDARKLAEEERDRAPKEIAPWLFLVNLASMQGDKAAAMRVVDEAEKNTGRQSVWAFTRVGALLQAKRTDEAKKMLAQLEAELNQFPEPDRNKLLFGLADSYNLLEDREKPEKLMAQVAERLPDDIYVRFRLFEFALRAGHEANMQKWLEEIRKVEGPGGAMALYAEAALQVQHWRKGDKTALEKAAPLLRELNTLRPTWSRVALLEGTILEAQDQKEKALEKYKLARKYGESRLEVIRHMVWLLYDRGRLAEAETLMRQLPDEALVTGDMKRMAASITLLAHPEGDQQTARARALDLARKASLEKGAEYQDFVWLGLLAAAADQPAEAEKALRKAREMKPDVAGTWAPLVALLARTDPRKAELELREAEKVLPKEQSVLVLAAGYEALGQDKQAEEAYKAALAAQPTDVNLLRNASGFYRRIGQPAKAEDALRKILDPATKANDSSKAWANRNLALTLAARGGYANFQKAVKLLESNVDLIGDTDEDKRARALVLGTQAAHRTEAIKIFEGLSHNQTPTPETQFLLAQLYDADGKWFRAKPVLTSLVETQQNNTVYLTRLITMLLRHKQADEAMPYVERLVKLKPNQPETVVLQVRALKDSGREREAREKVHAYQQNSNASLEIVGHLFEELGMKLEAEQAFETYAAAAKTPQEQIRNLALALFLGRVGKTEKALSICEQCWKTCPPGAVAATAVSVLRGGQVGEHLQREAIRQIEKAVSTKPADLEMRYFLAECHDVLGHLDEAVSVYREVLKINGNHIPSLNNLAMLLALKDGKNGEALQLINKAIEMTGPIAELLDTRAMVYLGEQQALPAITDLKEAIRLNPKPLYYFHLARAYHMNQDRVTATDWMDRARKGGLTTAVLPRLEQQTFESLNRELLN